MDSAQHVVALLGARRFDTPSKVVAGIQALITKRSLEWQAPFQKNSGLALLQV